MVHLSAPTNVDGSGGSQEYYRGGLRYTLKPIYIYITIFISSMLMFTLFLANNSAISSQPYCGLSDEDLNECSCNQRRFFVLLFSLFLVVVSLTVDIRRCTLYIPFNRRNPWAPVEISPTLLRDTYHYILHPQTGRIFAPTIASEGPHSRSPIPQV